jgi:rare lipoprotein A
VLKKPTDCSLSVTDNTIGRWISQKGADLMLKRLIRWSTIALVAAVSILPVANTASASTTPSETRHLAIGYKAVGGIGQVTINDKPAIVLRQTSQAANAGQLARTVAVRLNELQQARMLRADQVTPAVSQGQYEVRVGKKTILVVDKALAQAERVPAALVAMRMTNQLRQALGGVPFEVQASRGLIAGNRSVQGEATWYGEEFHGRSTSSGERYDIRLMTCAHRTLPFGTLLLVSHAGNGRSVLVRVNDRGPWGHANRVIDLTPAAYRLLAPLNSGVIPIKAEIVSLPTR